MAPRAHIVPIILSYLCYLDPIIRLGNLSGPVHSIGHLDRRIKLLYPPDQILHGHAQDLRYQEHGMQ